MAGTAAALLFAVLLVKLTVVLVLAGDRWLAVNYSAPQASAEVTRLVVGLPLCVVAVLLLADRSGHRMGGLLLAAGAVWIVPSAVFDLFAFLGSEPVPVAAAMILLGATGIAGHPLTVLLLPLCFLHDSASRRGRWGVIVGAGAVCLGYGVLWALGTPGSHPFPSPWSGTAVGEWAMGLLEPSEAAVDWVSRVVTVVVTADLVRRALREPAGDGRRVWALLAVAYPACVCLLLSDVWGESWTVAARAAGSAVWVAVICLAAARGGMWRLERVTSHRLAGAFVLTALAAAAVCTAVAAWATLPAARSVTVVVVACGALVVGWTARPVVLRTSLAVERAFYGPRARPYEAMRALAVRLRQAPHPGHVPEEICRSVVEDLGLAGAAIGVDTRSGPRWLAAVGAPVTEPKQTFVLRHHGQAVGRLEVARGGTSTPAERDSDLLSLLADQAGPALAALRLGQEAQAAREHLVLAREEERRRLRREIHDGLGPQLAAAQLRLGTAQACSPPSSAATEHLRVAAEGLGEALAEVRRITAGLTPAALVEHGLLGATRTLAHRLGTDDVRVTVAGPRTPLPALAPGVEIAAYRIAAEAVTNAVRHAGARRVEVAFDAAPTALTVVVTDDGTGFDTAAVPGTGLASVAERAEEIGGTSAVASGPDGTTVSATLPLASHPEHPEGRR
ncbi:ATP-binding protein [Streptomyces sp. ISL-11]|nr:ATP-binding protein [Streptomyces sp. ISL-11]